MISVYADGSSHNKGGLPGGWAWVLVWDGNVLAQGSGHDCTTTNNRMELQAAIQGLTYLLNSSNLDLNSDVIELVSDSQVTLGIASGRFTPTKNIDLAEQLRSLVTQIGCRTRWVKGHAGNIFNERCDQLAKQEKTIAKAKTKVNES